MRRWLLMIGLFALLSLVPSVPRASAHNLCFADKTPYCLKDPFSDYWEANGGLPVFGYPIGDAARSINPGTGMDTLNQWLERNRFEVHEEHIGTPHYVQLGLLGKERLAQLGRDWHAEPREAGPQDGCLWFAQTGHNVCNQQGGLGFKAYWEGHGLKIAGLDKYAQSLQLFGLPLTAPKLETNANGDTVLTQWFERARFEWHPNNPDDFKVLLGRLGSEIRETPQHDLQAARDRWARQGSRSYDFELSISCFCPPDYTAPVLIKVRDGAPISITSVSSGKPIDDDRRSWYERYDTVGELFAVIEDAIDRNAARLTVDYDPALGYPTVISIDYDFMIADEELYLTVGRLALVQ